MGKSAILAKYVQDTGCIAHFNVQGQYESPEEFLKTIYTELIHRYQLPSRSLPTDDKQYASSLYELLVEVAQKRNGEPVVIAIDALDEVEEANRKTGFNILYLPVYLPEGVYFVMTKRRDVDVFLRTNAPNQRFNLIEFQAESREDVCAYIQNRIKRSEELQKRQTKEPDFVDKIADKSQNNFMYLVYVLDDIEKGLFLDLSLDSFPTGLQKYYEWHWRRMGMTAKPLPQTKINIVYHLAESRQPISCQLISEYVGKPGLKVQEVLEEWQQFLHKQFIEEETCYSVYHASFRDFLHRLDIVKAAGVSLKAIKKQKSDTLWEAMFGDE